MVATENCNCPAFSPYPSCEPNTQPLDCKILYYLGEDNVNLTATGPLPQGVLNDIYLADQEDWVIPYYSAMPLYLGGILPPLEDPFWDEVNIPCPIHKAFTEFTLTEAELLNSKTYETWINYNALWLADNWPSDPTAPAPSIDDCAKPFGILVAEALGISLTNMSSEAMKAVSAIIEGNVDKLATLQNGILVNPCANDEQNRLLLSRLEGCWNWFKGIYDNYYGKKFFVKIGNDEPLSTGLPFRGICVRNSKGEAPIAGKYFIQGNGSGQGCSVTDEVSTDGGFPSKNITNILGLKNHDLDFVKTEDGKIESFVKVGYVTDEQGNTKYYKKFIDYSDGSDAEWYFDITKLSPDNYLLKYADLENIENDKRQILYIKATVDDRIYFIEDAGTPTEGPGPAAASFTYVDQLPVCPTPVDHKGQWALLSLAEQIPIELKSNNSFSVLDILKIVLFFRGACANQSTTEKTNCQNFHESLKKLLDHVPKAGTKAAGATTPSTSPEPRGALNGISQLNLLEVNQVSLLPQGAVIPMKSNIYSYGPYYFNGAGENRDQTGGVEFIKEDILAPWNFSTNNTGVFDIQYAYETMNCTGIKLAVDSAKGLQQLEKGRITLAEIPTFSLGHSVDNSDIFPDKDGPTILTDISVDFGSSGFRTTYNFETFTPRFGRASKRLLDRLNEKIKETNKINSYLRQDRLKNSNTFKTLQQTFSSSNLQATGSISPIYNKKSTPNKLLISGYYLSNTDLYYPNYSPPPDEDECCDPPEPTDPAFDPCKDPPDLPEPSDSPIPNDNRIYSFAETHEAYQAVHVQDRYEQLHIMSMDGLFLPVSLRGDRPNPTAQNTGLVARFSMRTENNKQFIEWKNSTDLEYNQFDPGFPNPSKTRDEIPPFRLLKSTATKSYSLPINQQYLNPYLSSELLKDWDIRKNGTTKGFVISSISFGRDFTDYQLTHNNVIDENDQPLPSDDEVLRQQQNNFRFSALRGPLVIQGWGYDTTGKPIPNKADSVENAERGKFRKDKLTDKFLNGWIHNPRTWPVGPVDLRFDRERGVWTCPSPNKIVVARLKQTLRPNGKAQAQLMNPEAAGIRFYQNYHISGPNGENVKLYMQNTLIMVYDFIGANISANDMIYAYYDDNRYIVLESGRAYKGTDQDGEYWDFSCTTQTTTTATPTTPPCSWYGLDSLKEIKNYNSEVQQVLAHDDKGCPIWIDTTEC